jgi:O-antigen/teichoic acid export membrane protein
MNQLKAGAVLNYVVIILNMLVGLLYTPYMLRMMGQSEYGLYSLVASVIAYLTVLDLGMGNAIVRYTAKYRAEGKTTEQYEMFGMFLVLYIVIGIIAFASGLGLYFNVDTLFGATMTVEELDKARIMMLFLIFNLAVTFPMSIFGSIITAYERFVFPKTINIIRTLLNTAIMICLLEMGYKAVAMVVLQTVFNLLTLIINYFYCKYKLKIKIFFRNFKWSFLKEVAVYSFWIFLNVIMDRIYWNTGQFVLGAFVGTTAVAVFALAIQLEHIYMNFSTAISSLFLPKVTSMVTKNDNKKEISDLFIKTGRIQYIVMCLMLSGFIVFGRDFIILWAGPGYEEVYIITLMFFVALLIPLIQNLGITILQARNQMKFRSLLYIGIAVVSLVFQIVLSKEYGGIGCAISIAGALLLGQGLVMNIYYRKKQELDVLHFWKEILKMSIVPIILIFIANYLLPNFVLDSWIKLGAAIGIFVVVYIPLFWMFSMNRYEKDLFITPLKKIVKR